MSEGRASRELADAVLEGDEVDWRRAEQDSRVSRLAATLGPLGAVVARPASGAAAVARTLWARRLATSSLLAVTACQLTAALVGYVLASDATTPIPPAAAILVVIAFTLASAWLFLGAQRDSRAFALATVFLLIASAFARRFVGVVAGTPVTVIVRGVFPDAFLPAFTWPSSASSHG